MEHNLTVEKSYLDKLAVHIRSRNPDYSGLTTEQVCEKALARYGGSAIEALIDAEIDTSFI